MAGPDANRRGILSMLAAMALFAANDTLMKLAREAFPTGQALTLRSVFATMTGILMVMALSEGPGLRLALKPYVMVRGLTEALTSLCFIAALGMMPLGNLTAIVQASPVIIVVIAVMTGIERIGWRRALAVVTGFAGVLIVARPSPAGFDLAALLALATAFLVAARDLVTRLIGAEIPATVISLVTTIMVGMAGLAIAPWEVWRPIANLQLVYIGLAAVLVSAGTLCVVNAFRTADVGVIAGYRYAIVPMTLVIGYLVWGDVPDRISMVGIALIAASGLYTLHRQRVRPDSELKASAVPPT